MPAADAPQRNTIPRTVSPMRMTCAVKIPPRLRLLGLREAGLQVLPETHSLTLGDALVLQSSFTLATKAAG